MQQRIKEHPKPWWVSTSVLGVGDARVREQADGARASGRAAKQGAPCELVIGNVLYDGDDSRLRERIVELHFRTGVLERAHRMIVEVRRLDATTAPYPVLVRYSTPDVADAVLRESGSFHYSVQKGETREKLRTGQGIMARKGAIQSGNIFAERYVPPRERPGAKKKIGTLRQQVKAEPGPRYF